MTPFAIVTIVRTLLEAGQTDEQIARSLGAMLDMPQAPAMPRDQYGTVPPAIAPQAPAVTASPAPLRRTGIAPQVVYKLVRGMTAARLQAKLTPGTRPFQVAMLVAENNKDGIGKRAVMAALGISDGSAMSAIHNLQTREIVQSVPLHKETIERTPTTTALVSKLR